MKELPELPKGGDKLCISLYSPDVDFGITGLTQGWGKYIDSVLGYKYKNIKNVQVQVQVQGFAKCTWVLPISLVEIHCLHIKALDCNG